MNEAVGNKVTVKVIKSKVSPPFKSAIFNIRFGEGIDKITEILDNGVLLDILQKKGSWYAYNGTNIANSKAAARQFLEDNPEMREEIELTIKKLIHG